LPRPVPVASEATIAYGDPATVAVAAAPGLVRVTLVTVSLLNSVLKSALGDLENSLETRIADRLEKRIREEEETTRRHFDIMVEKVNDSVRLVAEVAAHHSSVLDNHEARLQTPGVDGA